MMSIDDSCAFCGAAGHIVAVSVLDTKWCRRFGGDPVVALDHGWYMAAGGGRQAADRVSAEKFFGSQVRSLCDYCAHGWVEDVRWRAEPSLLAVAQRRAEQVPARDIPALVRWAQLTAMLAERIDGMPRASSTVQRDAVRRGTEPVPAVRTWFFSVRQRLPARIHLSQVPVGGEDGGTPALLQIVSVDLAHLSVLVVLPSDDRAAQVQDDAALPVPPAASAGDAPAGHLRSLDLSTTRHPHGVAVQQLCAASASPTQAEAGPAPGGG